MRVGILLFSILLMVDGWPREMGWRGPLEMFFDSGLLVLYDCCITWELEAKISSALVAWHARAKRRADAS